MQKYTKASINIRKPAVIGLTNDKIINAKRLNTAINRVWLNG